MWQSQMPDVWYAYDSYMAKPYSCLIDTILQKRDIVTLSFQNLIIVHWLIVYKLPNNVLSHSVRVTNR